MRLQMQENCASGKRCTFTFYNGLWLAESVVLRQSEDKHLHFRMASTHSFTRRSEKKSMTFILMKIFNTTDDSSLGIEVFDKGHRHGRGIKASKSVLGGNTLLNFLVTLCQAGRSIQRWSYPGLIHLFLGLQRKQLVCWYDWRHWKVCKAGLSQ